MTPKRHNEVKKYIVFHLKQLELIHIFLLTLELSSSKRVPANGLEHSADRFKETLLGMLVTSFMSITDARSKSTNAKTIWLALYPLHSRSIERIWNRQIAPGVASMKNYRDKAGVHGDEAREFFAAKMGLIHDQAKILKSLSAYLSLSNCLLKRQSQEIPELESEIQSVLLDLEFSFHGRAFNRRWLRDMKLLPSVQFTKRFY